MKANTTFLFPTEQSTIILERLINQYHPVGNQVYDIEIVSIMLDNKISQIATFNQKDFTHITEIIIFKL